MKRLLVFFVLVGCRPHSVDTTPDAPVAIPGAYDISAAGQKPEEWWKDFDDTELQRLVDLGLTQNLQLRAAWARLDQANAMAGAARSGFFPALSLNGTAQRQKLRSPFADAADAPPGLPETFAINQFTASAQASYEVDLWRRIGSGSSAADNDLMAARFDAEASAMTVAAEITEAYFDVLAQRTRRALLVQQQNVNETFLELIQLRFEKGLASSLDLLQQQQQLAATAAQVPLAEAALDASTRRLALLVGRPASALTVAAREDLPKMPAVPGTGLPADLMIRRPDVKAAQARVVAADYRVAVAVANRLPGLRLTGSLSEQGDEVDELIANPLWSLLAAITAPIFQGGRLAAEVDRSEAVVRERLYQFGHLMLGAMVEVETALARERKQTEYVVALEKQAELAASTLTEARTRYRQGLSDFLPVLTALQSEQQAQLQLITARRQALSFRVQLCRALGGTWTQKLSNPEEEKQ